jgi:hypothetical protein
VWLLYVYYQPIGRPEAITLRAGDAVVFPSKRLLHQVAAVTHGQRKSLALFARTPSKVLRSAYDSDDDDNDEGGGSGDDDDDDDDDDDASTRSSSGTAGEVATCGDLSDDLDLDDDDDDA